MDPGFALASAGLGEADWHQYDRERDPRWVHEALTNCRRAEAQAPKLANAHVCLGVVYNGTGEYEQAAAEFQKALSLDSTSDDAVRGLADAYMKLERFGEAESTFQKAVQLRPQYWGGYAWLGGFYFRRARYDDAARMYTEWIALAPDSFQGYNNLGAMYLLQGRYAEAVPQLRRSADINPTLDAFSNLGVAYFYQGNFVEAARAYRGAALVGESDSSVYTAWGNLAEAYYWDPGQRNLAAPAYRRAISLATERLSVNPRDPEALSGLALYHAMMLEKREARDFLQRALRLAPNDADIQVEAAKVEVQFGQYPAALVDLEKSRKLGGSAYVIRDDPEFRVLASDLHFQRVVQP